MALKEENEKLKEQVKELEWQAANAVVVNEEARRAWAWACPFIIQSRQDLADKISPMQFYRVPQTPDPTQ